MQKCGILDRFRNFRTLLYLFFNISMKAEVEEDSSPKKVKKSKKHKEENRDARKDRKRKRV